MISDISNSTARRQAPAQGRQHIRGLKEAPGGIGPNDEQHRLTDDHHPVDPGVARPEQAADLIEEARFLADLLQQFQLFVAQGRVDLGIGVSHGSLLPARLSA
jgi:hypothetical protein